jgi:signal transduction histidine kinase
LVKQEIQILIVEDSADDAQIITWELTRGGVDFACRRVDTKEQFIDALTQQPPDLILSDHGLPAFDGFSALAIARERVPDVPFIFVTGSLGEETAITALKSGAADYVLKHRLVNLAPAVHRALCQAEERAKRREAEAALRRSEEQVLRLNAELEQRIARRTAQLEAANKELEAFSYSVSHDLRAPLRHIEGFIDMLAATAGPKLDEQCRGFIKTIGASARQMNKLIDDLLAYSRMSRAEMSRTPIEMGSLVESVRQELLRGQKERCIQWNIAPLPCVAGDPVAMRQVLCNLLSNAIKYTRPCAEARIEIGANQIPTETVFFVRDNGVGFEAHYGDKLFRVFQRLHSASEFEGTGIGLAIVQRIMARHGGRVWAEGNVGQGATFYFAMPNQLGTLLPQKNPFASDAAASL